MKMVDINKEIGLRLKCIRHIFNEGKKLSAEQFGHLLGESRDNITNYESGRAGLPVRVLFELYRRGINPIYLIAGEGDVFADNVAGKAFAESLAKRNVAIGNVGKISKIDLDEPTKFLVRKVAAGKLPSKEEAN